jgi:hypothetical protein
MLILLLIANLVVGGLIGISGIGGFFLPIIYTAVAGMPVRDALFLSFSTFAIAGLVAVVRYGRMGYIRYRTAVWLCGGSFIGAMLGVYINSMLPVQLIKALLYTMVLLAGLSLFRKNKEKDRPSELLNKQGFLIILGFLVGVLCSMSGAGGALIFVPVLVALGEDTRYAVGMGILGSLIISIPSSVGYFLQIEVSGIFTLLLGVVLVHIVGIFVGSHYVSKINLGILKKGIAFFSIASALFLMFRLFA